MKAEKSEETWKVQQLLSCDLSSVLSELSCSLLVQKGTCKQGVHRSNRNLGRYGVGEEGEVKARVDMCRRAERGEGKQSES